MAVEIISWSISTKVWDWVGINMETTWGVRTKVYTNGPDHMTKMATMPIYG